LSAKPTVLESRNAPSWSLHRAALRGETGTVGMLLKMGVAVDIADKDGKTPLHDACSKGRA
jgi:ankyrin repeat protein